MNQETPDNQNIIEERILSLEEQTATYAVVKRPGISQGRQSRVQVLEFKFATRSELILWKHMGVGKGLTEKEAKRFHKRLRTYRRSLRSGLEYPQVTYVSRVGSEWLIFSYEQFIPRGDGDHVFRDGSVPNYRKWFLLRTVVGTLAEYPPASLKRKVLLGRKLTMLPHGLDLKLANLVASDGRIWFVDLFGPKELNGSGRWLTYSRKIDSLAPDKLIAVYATREGLILRLFRLAEPSWISSGSIGIDSLRVNFEDVLEQSGIPQKEMRFIMDEVSRGFPWLDELYSESRV